MPHTIDHAPEQSLHLPTDESNIVALRLESKGDRSTRRAPTDPELLVTIPEPFGRPFRDPMGAILTPADQRWFAALTTSWVRRGSPASLRVPFSTGDALEVFGSAGAVRDSLLRLRATTVDGPAIWGLVERASTAEARDRPGDGWVELSRHVAELLQDGRVTYLHAPTWDRMREQDEVASRLWVFLETQEMPTLGRRYEVFSAPADTLQRRRRLPAVADLVGVGQSVLRRHTVDRIQQALRTLVDLDPSYLAQIVKTARPGMWRLEVRRRRFLRSPHRDG